MRILVIDDEISENHSLILLLKSRGHEVTVSNGTATDALNVLGASLDPKTDVLPEPGLERLQTTAVPREGPVLAPVPAVPLFDAVVLDLMMEVGEEGRPGGLLEMQKFDNAGIGILRLLRQGAQAGLEWAANTKVFVYTSNRTIEARHELDEIAAQYRSGPFEVRHKPTTGICETILGFFQPSEAAHGE